MRKMFTKLIIGAILISTLATSASAAQSATENFYVYINGGAVVSSKMAEKTGTGMMWVSIDKMAGSRVNWVSSETVNYRGRSPSGAQATTLGQTNKPTGTVKRGYLSGYGSIGSYYRMAVQYDNSNPYTRLELTATWMP